MKASKFFLSTLVAAATMTSSAYADTTVGETETVYAGDIYTFGGWNGANFHDGGYIRNDVSVSDSALTNVEFGGTGNWLTNTSDTFLSIASLFSSANGGTPLNTLRFVSAGDVTIGETTKTVTARAVSVSFNDLRLGGLIVESGASGNSIVQYNARTFQLGDSTNAKTFVGTINENFTLTANNTNFYGSQNWTIASGKTLTVTNTGTVDGTVNLLGAGTLKIGTLSGAGRIDLGSAGNLTISNGTKFNNWTGTVALSNRSFSGQSLAQYGISGSTIELTNVSGWFSEGEKGSIAANLKLSKTSDEAPLALKITNGWSTGTITFSGAVSGDGTLRHCKHPNGNLVTQSYTFTGDLSGFSGTIETDNENEAKGGNLTFGNGSAGVTSGSVTGTGIINWTTGSDHSVVFNYSNSVYSESLIEGETKIRLAGGDLTLKGANTYTGGTTVAAGTLIAGSTSAFGSGNLTVESGASLSSGAYDVDLTSGNATINGTYVVTAEGSLATTGTITLSEGSIVDVSALESAGNYTIFSAGTFTNSGATFKKARARDTATLSNEGELTFTVGSVYEDLEWNSGVWKDGEKSWTRPGQEETFDFQAGDSVTFSTENASVTVEGTVAPNKMTVSDATTLTGTGTVEVANANLTLGDGVALSIAEGVTLALGTEKNGTLNKNITGSGTISWGNWGSGQVAHGVTIALGQDFTGTLNLTGNIETAALVEEGALGGTKKVVLDGVWLWSDDNLTHTLDVEVEVGSTENRDSRASGNLLINGGDSLLTFEKSFSAEGKTVGIGGDMSVTFKGTTNIGTLNVSGGTTTISGKGTNTIGNIRQTGGTINVNEKTSATQFVGTSTSGTAGTLNIGSSGVLTITGNSNSVTGNEGSFQLAHWPNTQTVNVDGVLNLQGAGISNKDGNGDIYVKSGGEMNFNAGLTAFDANNNSGVIRVHLAEGGRINVGTGGITDSTVLTLNLNGGTIGSLTDSWSSARALTLGGDVTIDTTRMAFNASGKATETSDGSSIELSNVLSGEGALIKTGAGTLTLSGTNTYTGGTTISVGTLIAGSASALGDGAVTVSGGQLNVNNVTISNAVSIVLAEGLYANTAAVIGTGALSGNIVVNAADLNALTILEDVTYKLWDGNALVGDFENRLSVTGLDSTWKYDVSEEGIFTLYAPIPEPSAFGLLAGVGALALVAARRRRRS